MFSIHYRVKPCWRRWPVFPICLSGWLPDHLAVRGLLRKWSAPTDWSGKQIKLLEYLKTCAEDKPLGTQIFGADPEIMAQAACIVAGKGADFIDINMGCPVRKVIKSGAGAILMKDPALVGRIVAAVRKAVSIPVTVKIRSGWSRHSINGVEIARIAEDSGADAITIHARTADQGYSGNADWRIIAEVKKAVRIPVIGNGDIRRSQDAIEMMKQSSCDAVMIGRASLGNPWLFTGINQLLAGEPENCQPELTQRYEIIKKHWSMEVDLCGLPAADRNFRKHLIWYTKGLEESSRFRQLIGTLSSRDCMLDELDKYFQSLSERAQNNALTFQG